ncbi:MAG: hypothetical protein A2Y04_01320 [Omnitrophica WOR_2 bacterium GWC2_45_7]|nr:MAG: hypothetical protein A2Z81_06310 [Omnitrophica WOR_2 bacterium GWA2_45_18]OGX19446.1 MAG: hypothetical protein A2Y04_01320 [Omnitrophica WOR_2 bacterium GWC2_45_7]
MNENNITPFYEKDHDELDSYLKTYQEKKRTDFPRAKEFFKRFKFGLQRHIVWEEEILFPVFEDKTGMRDVGPTAVMRQEHVLIKEALEKLHQKVRMGDPETDKEEAELLNVLGAHNEKEENILYPAIDEMATEEEKKEVFEKMKLVPEEKYMGCGCGH